VLGAESIVDENARTPINFPDDMVSVVNRLRQDLFEGTASDQNVT